MLTLLENNTEEMVISVPACMIDALGAERAVTRAIEEILTEGTEAIVSALNVTLFPADMDAPAVLVETPETLRSWWKVAVYDEDALNPIEFRLQIPCALLWGGSAMPGAIPETVRVAA